MKGLGAAKGELVGIAYCKERNELWVCDVLGFVYILDS